MFGNAFGWPHLLIILAVLLLLFGATRLPALSRSIAQSVKVFRKEVKPDDEGSTKPESGSGEDASGGEPSDKS